MLCVCRCVCYPACAIWIMLCIAGVASQTTHSWNSNNKGSTEGYAKLKGFRMSHDSCACQANWQSNTRQKRRKKSGMEKQKQTERRESWKLVCSLFQLSYDWRINLGQFGMLIERAEIDRDTRKEKGRQNGIGWGFSYGEQSEAEQVKVKVFVPLI